MPAQVIEEVLRQRAMSKDEANFVTTAFVAEDWPVAALLWLCIWLTNTTFLHVPRNGGQSIERLDHTSPRVWLSAIGGLDNRGQPGAPSLSPQPRAHSKRCLQANGPLWLFPPELIEYCQMPAWNPYLNRSTYCVVREPFSRFVSAFLLAKRSGRQLWPESCSMSQSLAQQMRCFANVTTKLIQPLKYQRRQRTRSAAALERNMQPIKTDDLLLQLLPQSHYVSTGHGPPTCDIVFDYATLIPSGLPVIASSLLRQRDDDETQNALGALASELELQRVLGNAYSEDFDMWKRIQDGRRPTPAHERNLSAHIEQAKKLLPDFFASPPNCRPGSCTCKQCCDEALAKMHLCTQCVLASPLCGGPGEQPTLAVPRSLAPVCKQTAISPMFPERLHVCNTCDECCNKPWVEFSGSSCRSCEVAKCRPSSERLSEPEHQSKLEIGSGEGATRVE